MTIELRPVAIQLSSTVVISPPVIKVAATLGTFFLPNTTAAAGGAAKLIAASMAGATSVFFPACLMLTVPNLLIFVGLMNKNDLMVKAGLGLNFAAIMYILVLAAKAATLTTGIATGSLVFCALTGYFAILAGTALAVTALIVGAIGTRAAIQECSR